MPARECSPRVSRCSSGGVDALRILIVAPFPPSLEGVHGGARVIAQRLARLAERHEVMVLHFEHNTDSPSDDSFRHLVTLEAVERRTGSRLRRAVAARLGLLAGRPLWAAELAAPELSHRLAAAVERFGPDIIQFEYVVMAQHARVLTGSVPRLLVDHDTDRETSLIPAAGRGVLRHLDRLAWRRFERRILADIDAAVVFTERDRRSLEQRSPRTRIVRIRLGTDAVDEEIVAPASAQQILFIGNFVHSPNVHAARRLVHSILPRVRERVPGAAATVVGGGAPQDLATGQAVTVTGLVDSVRPYYEQAAAFAVPLESGGGMRVKVMEALALGVPVVATPLALEGLDVEDGEQVLVATTDEEFVERILQLLTDPQLGLQLRGRAAAWARENLQWQAVMEAYDRLYEELAALDASRPLGRRD